MGKSKGSLTEWWVSCPKMTVCVSTTEDNIVRDTPAIVRRFRGQDIRNLVSWFRKKFGSTTIVRLGEFSNGG